MSIIILLLTLTLLPITPIAAVGPKPKEKADVTLEGDITGSGLNLDVGLHGKLVIIYGDADLTFVESTGLWREFGDSHEGELGIRIDKSTGDAQVSHRFGVYTAEDAVPERYVGWSKYQFETNGIVSKGSIPYGTIEVMNEDFKIYQLIYQQTSKKKGKGATGVTYDPVLSGVELSFTIIIE